MFARFLMIFAVMVLVSACSTTKKDDGLMDGDQASREGITTEGPLSDIYDVDSEPLPGSQADLVVNVGDRVFFGTDQSDLSAEARAVLDKQAAWLAQYPDLNVIIEGHADERGTREYNLALGERRANAAASYLKALGVDARRIETVTYGKERPAVTGFNDEAWSQNRRAVTVIE